MTQDHELKSCWNWPGAKNNRGYGHLVYGGKHILAHRLSYMLSVGRIPNNMTVHHLCNNPLCINPKHLTIMTQKENNLLGNSPTAVNKRKTHCVNGHLLEGHNLIIAKRPDGLRRKCRECNRLIRKRRYYEGKG